MTRAVLQSIKQSLIPTASILFGMLAASGAQASAITETNAFPFFSDNFDIDQDSGDTYSMSESHVEDDDSDLPYAKIDATAYADKATGKMGASSESSTFAQGYAKASMTESLYFNVAGANAATVTPIQIRFALDGEWGITDGAHIATADYFASLTQDGMDASFLAQAGSFYESYDNFTSSGWAAEAFDGVYDPSNFEYVVTYNLFGANPLVFLETYLRVETIAEAYSLFGDTASLSLILPDHVTFTSSSGVFLSAASAVPEPAALSLLALALLGLRRRTGSSRLHA